MPTCACQIDECVLCEKQLFSELSTEEICAIRGTLTKGTLTKHHLKPRQILFREGEPSTRLYAVCSGQVKLITSLPDGREQILRLGIAGNLLGFEAVTDEFYPYTVEAITPTHVCGILRKDMLQIIKNSSGVSLRVIHTLNQELEQSLNMIRDLGLKSASERVATFILSLLPIRNELPDDLNLPLTRLEMAEMLGLTEETVCRMMGALKREGAIKASRGHIVILDLERLQRLACTAEAVAAHQ